MEYQLGNYVEARRLFQEGVWADPGNKDVVFIFQVCMCSHGQPIYVKSCLIVDRGPQALTIH